MNFTYGNAIQTMAIVYNPSDYNTTHGTAAGVSSTIINLHAYEVIISVTVFGCQTGDDSLVCGLTLQTNNSRPLQVGPLTGKDTTLDLNGGYVAYWIGTSDKFVKGKFSD